MKTTMRRLVGRDGTTAFSERNGYWHDASGKLHYKVIGKDVYRVETGTRAFRIVNCWAIDETGAGMYYYGR